MKQKYKFVPAQSLSLEGYKKLVMLIPSEGRNEWLKDRAGKKAFPVHSFASFEFFTMWIADSFNKYIFYLKIYIKRCRQHKRWCGKAQDLSFIGKNMLRTQGVDKKTRASRCLLYRDDTVPFELAPEAFHPTFYFTYPYLCSSQQLFSHRQPICNL